MKTNINNIHLVYIYILFEISMYIFLHSAIFNFAHFCTVCFQPVTLLKEWIFRKALMRHIKGKPFISKGTWGERGADRSRPAFLPHGESPRLLVWSHELDPVSLDVLLHVVPLYKSPEIYQRMQWLTKASTSLLSFVPDSQTERLTFQLFKLLLRNKK